MKFSRKRAVSPIIASLLLIAIAVAAGIIVYVYVNSLAGNLTGGGGGQETQQIQLQSYSFNPLSVGSSGFGSSGTQGTGQTIDVFLENTGSSALAVNAIYFDGTQLTEWGFTSGSTYLQQNLEVPTASAAVGCYELLVTGTPSAAVTTSVVSTSVVGATSGATVCTANGASNGAGNCNPAPAFCVTQTSVSQTEESSLPAQSTVQLVIGLSSGWTPSIVSGTSHTIKLVTATGGQAVFTVVAGRSG